MSHVSKTWELTGSLQLDTSNDLEGLIEVLATMQGARRDGDQRGAVNFADGDLWVEPNSLPPRRCDVDRIEEQATRAVELYSPVGRFTGCRLDLLQPVLLQSSKACKLSDRGVRHHRQHEPARTRCLEVEPKLVLVAKVLHAHSVARCDSSQPTTQRLLRERTRRYRPRRQLRQAPLPHAPSAPTSRSPCDPGSRAQPPH